MGDGGEGGGGRGMGKSKRNIFWPNDQLFLHSPWGGEGERMKVREGEF